MIKYLVGVLIKEVVEAVRKLVFDFLKLQKKKKEDKAQVKEVLNEKDPQVRASRIRDLLK